MITKEQVIAALSNVEEPDLKKDLVTLGMIKDVAIDGKKVSFTVVLTTVILDESWVRELSSHRTCYRM